jgi:serine/threonine protein kinase
MPTLQPTSRVLRLLEGYLEELEGGRRPNPDELAARHPELAEPLRACLASLELLHGAALSLRGGPMPAAAAAVLPPGRLGEFRIRRTVGRGGMGVVYEAEHEALGRRVALKVLPVDAARNAKLLERFRRESRAAAQLHHSNIVPVFEVGQQGDVFYYAMQFIEGQPLDQVIQELQQLRAASGGTPATDPARSGDATMDCEPEPGVPAPSAGSAGDTPAPAAPSRQSELSMVETDYRLYCRNVARLGLQAAEALAYAHGRGIVHRDIKPANLLLDTTGVLWVSDFGLVKTADPALTDTGDLVGTLRYMAPERFRGECDVRADVYALGLTLYELLVLRPAFDGQIGLRSWIRPPFRPYSSHFWGGWPLSGRSWQLGHPLQQTLEHRPRLGAEKPLRRRRPVGTLHHIVMHRRQRPQANLAQWTLAMMIQRQPAVPPLHA